MRSAVNLEFPEILFDTGGSAYRKLAEFLKRYEGWMLVIDDHTNSDCLPLFTEKFGERPKRTHIIHSGDHNKTLERCSSIWTKLTEIKAGRNFALISLGGGMVSDITGFAAACYKRGIDYINIPTSLLAMVDAAHGGKTGVNYKNLKNQVGVFHMPALVLMDLDYLQFLSPADLNSGCAEILKHAILADESEWRKLKDREEIEKSDDLKDVLRRSVEIKYEFVRKDPVERGERKVLNFGHTIGHSFESYSHEKLPVGISHGEAVAAGMIVESAISADLGLLPEDVYEEIAASLKARFKLFQIDESDLNEVMSYVRHDKKNIDGKFNFTLIKGIGKPVIDQIVEPNTIMAGLRKYMALF